MLEILNSRPNIALGVSLNVQSLVLYTAQQAQTAVQVKRVRVLVAYSARAQQ